MNIKKKLQRIFGYIFLFFPIVCAILFLLYVIGAKFLIFLGVGIMVISIFYILMSYGAYLIDKSEEESN